MSTTSTANEPSPLSTVPRRLKSLVAIAGLAILLPCVSAFWIHAHQDDRFRDLGEWHVRAQGASHDAMLSVDELLWVRELRTRDGRVSKDLWLREDASLYNRILYYIDRIPAPVRESYLPAGKTITSRLDEILKEGAQLSSATPSDTQNLLLALRQTLDQLRLLHWQKYESETLAHMESRKRELSIVLPATASVVLVGLVVCGGILRSIRSQLKRERKLVNTLTVSEARYRNMVEHLPHGVEEFDREGTITYCNPAYHQMLGYRVGELQGCRVWTLLADEQARTHFRDHLHMLIDEEPPPQRFISRHRTKTGGEISVWVDWEYRRDADDNVSGFIAIITNITEREAAEKALIESEERYRSIVESTHDWIWEMGTDGIHTFSNKMGPEILGYSREELLETELSKLFHPEDLIEVQSRLPELIASGEGWKKWVIRMRRKQGGYRSLESSAFPVLDADGTVVGFRGVDHDITERIKLENRLRESLREKDTLLQEIHHRVKNNLQVISSLLHFQRKKAVGAHERELLGEAQARLKAMTLIHEQLYHAEDLSQIEIADYLRLLAEQLKAPYESSNNPIVLRVDAEPVELRVNQALPVGMVVTELMTNALKHAYPNGQARSIAITLRASKGQVRIAVSDTGIGFPRSTQPAPVASFGLTLVNNLAMQLGGCVSFEGDNGTTATLEFPIDMAGREDPPHLSGIAKRSPASLPRLQPAGR